MKRIKIKGPLTENLVLEIAGTKCIGDFEIPVNDQSGGAGIADTDFHFYVSAEDAEADWMAYATYCEYSFTVFRNNIELTIPQDLLLLV